MAYIERAMEPIVLETMSEYPAVLVTGSRQVGKTTMLAHLMERENDTREYLTLDDLALRALAKNDPVLFFQLHEPPVFIDEVQYAPELFGEMKRLIDAGATAGSFLLTGSQQFRLMELAGESLAGRIAILSLPSLSQRELIGRPGDGPLHVDLATLRVRASGSEILTAPSLFEHMHRGTMPAVASGERSNVTIYYSSYVQTYIERDVRRLLGSVDALEFLSFMTSVAARCSQMLNVNAIAGDVGQRPEKVKAWLSVLERSGIIFYLHPYSNNQLKRTVKAPKLYFDDCGLVAHLTRWTSAATMESGAMSGAFVENYVVSEIRKGWLNTGMDAPLYYYRDRDAREIDLVTESDGELHPIEIKKTASPNASMVRSFSALDRATVPRGAGAIVCLSETLGALDSQTFIVPVGLL